MKILIACEESQRVCIAFREKGHEAYSCDIIEPSGGHPEWHIKADVSNLLNGNCYFTTCDSLLHKIDGKWDMILAFPPCTHLAVSGARHFPEKRKDGRQYEAIKFFMQFVNADCDKICIENPVGIISGNYISQYFPYLCEVYGLPLKYTQIIHPWMFGDPVQKGTCLWLKGLPELVPEITVKPEIEYDEWVNKHGQNKRMCSWYSKGGKERQRNRSKTFPGVARAMAEQWG